MNADQLRGWGLKLQSVYEDLLKEHGLQLRPATVCTAPLPKGCLGRWDAGKRLISICPDLLNRGSWADVQHTLKHELAHQLAHESFGGADEKAHGPSFAKACALLGISPAASRSLSTDESSSVRRRIEKLLALSSSANQHEAEAALCKAQDLMFKHNIEMASGSSQAYTLRPLGPIRRRTASYEWKLINILCDFYFVKALHNWSREGESGALQWQFEIYGLPLNLDSAEYVYHFLKNQAELLWRDYRRRSGPSVSRMKTVYVNGLYDGFRRGMEDERGALEEKFELVYRGDPALEEFYRRCNPAIRRRKVSYRVRKGIYEDAVQEGREMKLRPGLKASAAAKDFKGLKGFIC